MITCPKCSKDNQDHYKFCLGCGAELPRDAAPKPFSPKTPPHGVRPAAGTPVAPAPAAAAAPAAKAPVPASTAPQPVSAPVATAPAGSPAAAAAPCPQCSHMNPPNNTFCAACGFRLGGAAPKPVAAPTPSAAGAPPGTVVLTALRADGSEAGSYTHPAAECVLGRDTGGIFAGDSYLSPKHATFRMIGNGRLRVRDEGSLNGVYKKLTREVPVELKPNDVFRIGQEIIRYESIEQLPPAADGVERLGAPSKGYIGRIALVIGRETTGNAFPLPETGLHIGRERGDVLFPEDGYVSGLHCHLAWNDGTLTLTDLGSSNGTFLRLKEEVEVGTGDVLLMGQQLFRISA